MPEIDRRNFLKLVGVSAGAAAASGCSDPVEKLIPYVIQPEEITPGLAVIYSSTCQECSAGCGLHVRTREGRPIKLEGNPNLSNIQPLLDNTGLGTGDRVFLRNTNVSCADVTSLRANGVTVDSACS